MITDFKGGSPSYNWISPNKLENAKRFIRYLSNRFKPEEVSIFLDNINNFEGELLQSYPIETFAQLEKTLEFKNIREIIQQKIKRDDEYFSILSRINIRIVGYIQIGKKSYCGYILIHDSRLSKVYGDCLVDIQAGERYNLFEAIEKDEPDFCLGLQQFLVSPITNAHEFVRSCSIVDDQSDESFPHNALYLYYNTPQGYVKDGFIDLYTPDDEEYSRIIPAKAFLSREIAGSEEFRKFLYNEAPKYGFAAINGSLSVIIKDKDATKKVFNSMRKKLSSLLKTLPSDDYIKKGINKGFQG